VGSGRRRRGQSSDATHVAAEPGDSRRCQPQGTGLQMVSGEYRAAWLPLERDEGGATVTEGACAQCVVERTWRRQAGKRRQRPRLGNHAKPADP